MRYLSVDDEAIAHSVIEAHCRDVDDLQCVATCASVDEARETLLKEPVDLIFLDVEMPRGDGFRLLRELPELPMVIIVSAHREYALDSFEFDVCDYLLKPFSRARFLQAIDKARARLGSATASRDPDPDAAAACSLYVRDEKGRRRIRFDDIVHIAASRNYSVIDTRDAEIVVCEKISALAERLPPTAFVRTHRSHIVALARITRVDAGQVLLGDTRVPVGRTYKPRVQALLRAGHRDPAG